MTLEGFSFSIIFQDEAVLLAQYEAYEIEQISGGHVLQRSAPSFIFCCRSYASFIAWKETGLEVFISYQEDHSSWSAQIKQNLLC
jgi:hypothetical protein